MKQLVCVHPGPNAWVGDVTAKLPDIEAEKMLRIREGQFNLPVWNIYKDFGPDAVEEPIKAPEAPVVPEAPAAPETPVEPETPAEPEGTVEVVQPTRRSRKPAAE